MGGFITKYIGIDPMKDWTAIEINENTDLEQFHRFSQIKEPETPWDRVKLIFEKDVYGDTNPAFVRIKDATLMSLLVGGMVGGINRSNFEFKEHFRLTAHEVFETPQHAQKMLQDKVFVGFAQGFFKLGWRFSLFTFMYMSSAAIIAQYRGKMGILDQVGGAATAGFLYKFKQGPKASIAGLVAGSGLGLIVGVVQVGVAKVAGTELQEMTAWQIRRQEAERVRKAEGVRVQRSKLKHDDAELFHFHENFVADDDMSYSTAKGTPVGQIKQALQEKLVPASEFAILPPKAAEKEFKEAMEDEERARQAYLQRTQKKEVKEEENETEKESEDKSDTATTQPSVEKENSSINPSSNTTESSDPKVNAEVIIEKVEVETSPVKPKQIRKIVDPRLYTFKDEKNMPKLLFRGKFEEPPPIKVEVEIEV